MRQEAVAAIFYITADYFKVAATLVAQEIERTVAEHAIKLALINVCMTREKCAVCIFEKFITVLHTKSLP